VREVDNVVEKVTHLSKCQKKEENEAIKDILICVELIININKIMLSLIQRIKVTTIK